jgi:hypothetical protein
MTTGTDSISRYRVFAGEQNGSDVGDTGESNSCACSAAVAMVSPALTRSVNTAYGRSTRRAAVPGGWHMKRRILAIINHRYHPIPPDSSAAS